MNIVCINYLHSIAEKQIELSSKKFCKNKEQVYNKSVSWLLGEKRPTICWQLANSQ